ncbi:MAG TPA: M50 family metallopeptidase [Methylomusa anaerophila]|uniref:Stage IV sporulation protein FB n=1 Tax=Methylomusa anaerophila TaxID=1930071 RepID=A0A348AF98_9FIRM|nr:M50 family metallopeptidase [Methylomusa anaerophila]BBB89746.1 stage IV sporulation protein FB [Methylomusa anaerophila]HML89208.1 M50 family metallopeptidase [Methylomusa anaerophila]
MRVGKVAGIQIILNNWFLLIISLFVVAGMSGKVLIVFSAVIFHELAHVFMARSLGYKVKEVEVLPFGAIARIDRLSEKSASSEIVIAAAGPFISLALAAVSYVGILKAGLWQDFYRFYFDVNAMLAGFNLLPALPLDGGRIVRALLAQKQDYQKATATVITIGKMISVVLLVSVVVTYWLDKTINITMIVAAVFLCVAAKAEQKLAGFRTMRVMARKKAALSANGLLPTSHFTAVPNAVVGDIIRLFGPEQYYIVLVVDDNFRLCGTLTETQVWEELPARGLKAKIKEFL